MIQVPEDMTVSELSDKLCALAYEVNDLAKAIERARYVLDADDDDHPACDYGRLVGIINAKLYDISR